MSLFKRLFGGKKKGLRVENVLESFQSTEAPRCSACKTTLSEEHQIGAGDDAAVMANLGIMQVKLRCPKCKTVSNVTLPFGYEWKSSIDIPGWGRFPR